MFFLSKNLLRQFRLHESRRVIQLWYLVYPRFRAHVLADLIALYKHLHHLKTNFRNRNLFGFILKFSTSIEIRFFCWTTSMLLRFAIEEIVFFSNRTSSTSKYSNMNWNILKHDLTVHYVRYFHENLLLLYGYLNRRILFIYLKCKHFT